VFTSDGATGCGFGATVVVGTTVVVVVGIGFAVTTPVEDAWAIVVVVDDVVDDGALLSTKVNSVVVT
jgi:hypothetical protein